jgi:hypothetical protein
MAKALAKTRKRYTPLDLVYSSSVSGALNQNYDASYQTYDPDRGLVPLEILFTVRATDPKKVINPGIINKNLTDIKWYENVVDEAHNIADSNTAYVIDRNGNSDSRGKLTVKKNTPLEGVVLIFTARYTDPRSGKVINVNATISLGVTVSTDEPLRVKVDYPYGQVVDPTENRDFVEIDNILYRGDEEYEGSIYRWLKKEGGDYTAIEEGDNGITGAYTGKLKVPCHVVGKRLDLRCETDVLPDLAGVNLVSKAMISDDWNALKSGISTPGEDADGKYLAIKQMELYNAFNNGKDDIFGEKIKYKPNQCYRLDVKWKMQGEQEHGGIVFVIKYTDGSSGQLGIAGGKVSLETVRLITKPGKTVQKITSLYGTNLHDTNLYDIQLVEYHGENLVEGRSKERLVNSSFIHKFTSVPAKNYSVRFDKSETIEASGVTSRSFQIYDKTTSARVSNITNVNDGEVGVIIVNDGIDPSHEFGVVAYAKQGLGGGSGKFYNLMLVEGEYTDETMPAYTPAADEFVPAIADGGERWQELSGKEITTDHVLSTQYPRCNTEIVAPSMILDDTSLFEASVIMHSSRGDIANPQLYWSFPWKDKTGAVFARGSKIFIKEEQFDNGEFDYSVDPVEGLNEAKWAANFNGIDQVLRNDNPVGIVPWGYGSVRTHVVEFIATAIPDEEFAILVQISGKLSSGVRGFAFAILKNGKMQYRVGGTAGEFPASLVREGTIDILPGKLYRVEVDISLDGTFKARVNGQEDSLVTKGGANYSSAFIGMGGTTSANFFTGKILRYIIHDATSSIYHEWDFQPTNGDRANMLKNKNHKGSVTGNSPLAPRNIPEIDNVDPENGFFVTI